MNDDRAQLDDRHDDEVRLTAYVLDELDAQARARVDDQLASDETARHAVDQLRDTADRVKNALADEMNIALTDHQRMQLERSLVEERSASVEVLQGPWISRRRWYTAATLAMAACVVVALALPLMLPGIVEERGDVAMDLSQESGSARMLADAPGDLRSEMAQPQPTEPGERPRGRNVDDLRAGAGGADQSAHGPESPGGGRAQRVEAPARPETEADAMEEARRESPPPAGGGFGGGGIAAEADADSLRDRVNEQMERADASSEAIDAADDSRRMRSAPLSTPARETDSPDAGGGQPREDATEAFALDNIDFDEFAEWEVAILRSDRTVEDPSVVPIRTAGPSFRLVELLVAEGIMPSAPTARVHDFINAVAVSAPEQEAVNDDDREHARGQLPYLIHSEFGPCPWDESAHLLMVSAERIAGATEGSDSPRLLPALRIVFFEHVVASWRLLGNEPNEVSPDYADEGLANSAATHLQPGQRFIALYEVILADETHRALREPEDMQASPLEIAHVNIFSQGPEQPIDDADSQRQTVHEPNATVSVAPVESAPSYDFRVAVLAAMVALKIQGDKAVDAMTWDDLAAQADALRDGIAGDDEDVLERDGREHGLLRLIALIERVRALASDPD